MGERAELSELIGSRLRTIRLGSGRTLASVAQAVGISSSALSQIESGTMQPSVNRLVEILGVLEAPVSAIFDGHGVLPAAALEREETIEPIEGVVVSRPAGSSQAVLGQGVVYQRLTPEPYPGLDLFQSSYPPGASSSIDGAMLVHAGYDMGSVVTGELTFEFAEGVIRLRRGESLAFRATRPHRVVNESDRTAVAIWLTVRNAEFTPTRSDTLS